MQHLQIHWHTWRYRGKSQQNYLVHIIIMEQGIASLVHRYFIFPRIVQETCQFMNVKKIFLTWPINKLLVKKNSVYVTNVRFYQKMLLTIVYIFRNLTSQDNKEWLYACFQWSCSLTTLVVVIESNSNVYLLTKCCKASLNECNR